MEINNKEQTEEKFDKRFNLKLRQSDLSALDTIAEGYGMSKSEVIRKLINQEYVHRVKGKLKKKTKKERMLTKKELYSIQMEIKKQLAEYERQHGIEMDAMILWDLHVLFGFGKARLKTFYDHFGDNVHDLIERYEYEEPDKIWVAATKLKEDLGIDIHKWAKEKEEREAKMAEKRV